MDSVSLSLEAFLPDSKPVFGIACFDDKIFTLHRKTSDLHVYDATSYKLTRRFPVSGLRNPLDISACSQEKCVYIVDGLDPSGKIYRVEVHDDDGNGPGSVTNWPVGELAMNASVTETGTILVTCGKAGLLKEFRNDGELVRQISLNSELCSAQHAILLTETDQCIVCHGWMDDSLHRICVVDAADGSKPAHTFGTQRGSARSKSLHNPSHMAVDSRGNVFLVDMGNRRVVVFDRTLQELGDSYIDDKKRLPSRLCLDESRGRLYVAYNEWKEVFWTSGTVHVFAVKMPETKLEETSSPTD